MTRNDGSTNISWVIKKAKQCNWHRVRFIFPCSSFRGDFRKCKRIVGWGYRMRGRRHNLSHHCMGIPVRATQKITTITFITFNYHSLFMSERNPLHEIDDKIIRGSGKLFGTAEKKFAGSPKGLLEKTAEKTD